METLGQYFRRQRELRKMDLSAISKETKIGQEMLAAMEEDRWDALPAEAFVRGFVRSYARALAIDENEVLLMYQERVRAGHGRRRPLKVRLKNEMGGRRFLPAALILLTFLLLLLLYFYL